MFVQKGDKFVFITTISEKWDIVQFRRSLLFRTKVELFLKAGLNELWHRGQSQSLLRQMNALTNRKCTPAHRTYVCAKWGRVRFYYCNIREMVHIVVPKIPFIPHKSWAVSESRTEWAIESRTQSQSLQRQMMRKLTKKWTPHPTKSVRKGSQSILPSTMASVINSQSERGSRETNPRRM